MSGSHDNPMSTFLCRITFWSWVGVTLFKKDARTCPDLWALPSHSTWGQAFLYVLSGPEGLSLWFGFLCFLRLGWAQIHITKFSSTLKAAEKCRVSARLAREPKEQWFLTRSDLPPITDKLGMPGTFFIVTGMGVGVSLASSGWRPGMLLDIL